MGTSTATPVKAYRAAVERIEAYERQLYLARRLRVDAIRAMRDAGMTWAQIEEETGLTRQRLNQLVREFPAS
jgi:predicted transcriptional regulator